MGWKREEREEREREKEGEKRERENIYNLSIYHIKNFIQFNKKKKSFISWYISDIYFYVDYT